MARYIKVNPKVAQYLHLENDRNRVKDGNYLLWQADILPFGRLTELPQILERIGGVALLAGEARQEQDGTVLHELPEPTDEAFKIVVVKPTKTDTEEPVIEQPAGDSVGNGDTGDAVEADDNGDNSAEPAEEPAEEQPEVETDKND